MENNGYISFTKMLSNIRTLEDINNQLGLKYLLQETNTYSQQQMTQTLDYLSYIERNLPLIHNSREMP